MDLPDVRMAERCEQLCLATDPDEAIFVGHQRPAQDFDGDVAIQLEVVGSIDVAHPAATEMTEHAVVRNARPDCHRRAAVLCRTHVTVRRRDRPVEARACCSPRRRSEWARF